MSVKRFIRNTRLLLEHAVYEARRSHGSHYAPKTVQLAKLEERLLFSASPVVVVAQVAEVADPALVSPPVQDMDSMLSDMRLLDFVADDVLPSQSLDESVRVAEASDPGEQDRMLELVFIDSSIGDIQRAVEDLRESAANDSSRTLEFVILDAQKDGIAQITAALLKHNGVDGLHILAHGEQGRVQLGSVQLSLDNMDRYRPAISAWQYSISEDTEIVFYGCDLASCDNGKMLLDEISQLTEASTSEASYGATSSADVAIASDEIESQTSVDDLQAAMSAPVAIVRHEIAFVDSQVDNFAALADSLASQSTATRNIEVVLLDSNRDGIQQIREVLLGRNSVDSIQIYSHGVDGAVQLGSTWLDSFALDWRADEISQWADSLSADADILLYGCDAAADAHGRTLVDQLAQLTGADVAASTDTTGHRDLGGDWTLEYATGFIETRAAIDELTADSWRSVLEITANGTATSAQGFATTSLSWLHTVASGTDRALFVTISIDSLGANVNSLTYGGVALTRVGRTGGNHAVEIWRLVNPVVGTANVVVSLSASTTISGGAVAYNGVHQTTSTGSYAGAFGTSTTAAVNVSSAAGELVIDVTNWDNDPSGYTVGSGQSQVWTETNIFQRGVTTTEAGASTVTMSSSVSAPNQWEIGAVAIRAASNSAPVLADTALSFSAAEDAGVPSGAVGQLVSTLTGGITDNDGGDPKGIAITSSDETNGTWFFSTNNGTNWTAIGAVSDASALLLAADANTRIYFQPNPEYSGTVNDAITFRAWDQSSGTNGGTADTTGNAGNRRDTFSTASYSNNDGSVRWASDWIESELDGKATEGEIRITGGALRFGQSGPGSNIYREVDLTGSTIATLSGSLVSNTLNGSDSVSLQISGNGGASYTTLYNITAASLNGDWSFDISSYISFNTRIRLYSNNFGIRAITLDNANIVTNGNSGGSSAFSVVKDVAVLTVVAVNDDPVITSDGGGANALVNVEENTSVVTTVTSTDVDGAVASYAISGGADAAKFAINSSTGELTFVVSPDFEAPTDTDTDNVYEVTIEVTDGVGGVDSQDISVAVTAFNDDTPIITSDGGGATAAVNVAENSTAVTTVTATDADLPTQTLSYSISGGADAVKFAIDTATGELTFISAPDFESPTDFNTDNVYEVTVEVTDGDRTDTQDISVTVTDLTGLTAVNDSFATDEHTILNVATTAAGLLSNDSDAEITSSPTSGNTLNYNAANSGGSVWSNETTTSGFDWAIDNFGTEVTFNTLTSSSYSGITGSYQFSGSNSGAHVTTLQNLSGDPTNASASFEVWFRTNTLSGQHIVFETGGANSGTSIFLDNAVLKLATASNGNIPDEVSVDLNALYADATAEFIQVIGVINQTDGRLELYVDGVLRDSSLFTSSNGSDWTGGDGAGIGMNFTDVNGAVVAGSGNLIGEIAIFRFYESALTASQAADNFAAVAGANMVVTEVNGNPVSVGNQIALASGALVTVNADGSFSYDPNGQFNYLSVGGSANDSFDYTVSNGAATDTASVAVTITGANDVPVITSNGGGGIAAVNVAENSTAVTTVTATDADLPAETLTYTISGGAEAAQFSINSSTGALSFVSAPDRETPTDANSDNVYEVTVQVSDGAGGTDSQSLSVTITDVDEFDVSAPIDTDGTANAVDENVANGTAVGVTGFATDDDATTNGVTYSLFDDAGGRFAINSATGVVTVADGTQLDREANASHNITVRATSADGSTADSVFTININDVDEFDVTAPTDTDGTTNAVDESAANGTTVGVTGFATDDDATTNGVTYSLFDDAGGRFAINSATGVVTVADGTQLDREVNASHDITVRATSADGSTADTVFTININDVDEFDVGVVTDVDGTANSVAENATVGTAVGITASASDDDATTNAITYTLDDDAGGLFAINGSTGVVTVNAALDYETSTSHSITVRATSADGSFSTQAFSISVTDVNENGVTAISDTDGAADLVAENSVNGTSVGVTAFADGTDSISYSLDDDAAGRFAINATTGEVTVAGAIDREAAGSYDITVRATSTDTSFTTKTFTISIGDVDEFDVSAPIDTDATANAVDENAANGTMVGITASASDNDATTNGVTYSLFDDAGGRFAINSATGVVTVADGTQLDREANASHNITVRATSADGSTADSDFTININDVDEFDVTAISDTDATLDNVADNAALGTTVGITAFASDADAATNAITYSLDDDALGQFAIHSSTGEVTVAGAIDREAGATRTITVRATSDDGSTIVQAFSITINDQNDAAPVVSPGQLFSVAENSTVGTTVGSVIATDADSVGSLQGWQILLGNTSGAFQIDSLTGTISVSNSSALNFETQSSYLLTLLVTDGLNRSLTETVVVQLVDVNEAPVLSPAGPFTLAENSALGTIVGSVSAADHDAADTLMYSIKSGTPVQPFSIDAVTGVISVTNVSVLDFEANPTFALQVNAVDSGGLTDQITVLIHLTNINEAPFGLAFSGNSVAENSSDGTVVGWVSGIDPDSGDALAYTLMDSASGRFLVDATTGRLTVANGSDLNYEASSLHGIEVKATDSSGLYQVQTFVILVSDVNEAPVAVAESFSGLQLTPINGSSGQLLLNDIDVDGDSLGVVLVSGTSNGTLSVTSDGRFTYVPSGSFSGVDSFTYQVWDGQLLSNVVTTTLNVQKSIATVTNTSSASGNSSTTSGNSGDTTTSDSSSKESQISTTLAKDSFDAVSVPSAAHRESGSKESSSEVNAPGVVAAGVDTSSELESGSESLALFSTQVFLDQVPESGGTAGLRESSAGSSLKDHSRPLWNEQVTSFNPSEAVIKSFFLTIDSQIVHQQARNQQQEELFVDNLVVGSTAVVSTSISVGYVVWMLRGGTLLSTFLSALPAWQTFDPLPVLESFERRRENDNESLLSMVTKPFVKTDGHGVVTTSTDEMNP